MEPYEIAKSRNFTRDVKQLEQLARHNINILRVTPDPICDELVSGGVTVDFEYQYRAIGGTTKWHKGSVWFNSQTEALQYVLDVAIELQQRLEKDGEW